MGHIHCDVLDAVFNGTMIDEGLHARNESIAALETSTRSPFKNPVALFLLRDMNAPKKKKNRLTV